MVTCAPMSAHWAWVPPEDHTNTGRLCSAGSRSDPVPRRQRSYAALRLPAPFGHGSGPPCQWPTSMRTLVLCLLGRRHVRPQRAVRRRRVTGSPHNRSVSRRGEGLPGYGAVLFVRAMVEHPAGYHPLLAQKKTLAGDGCCLQGKQDPRHPGRHRFRGRIPMAHMLARLRFAGLVSKTSARRAPGSGGRTLGRAGFAPAGRRTKFHGGIASSNSL